MDLHWNFTVETAVRLGKRSERVDLAWIEDPVSPENSEAQKRVTHKLDTPVSTGETLVRPDQFNDAASEGVTDVAAPDVNECGGLGESRKIAHFRDLDGVPIASHDASSPVGTVAGAHVSAAIPNVLAMEYHAREAP